MEVYGKDYGKLKVNVADAKHFLESFDNRNNLFSPDDFTDKTYIKGLKLGDPINITAASESCTYSKAARLINGKTYCFSFKCSGGDNTKRYIVITDDDDIIRQIPCVFQAEANVKRTFTAQLDGWFYVYLPRDASEIMLTFGDDHSEYTSYDEDVYGFTSSRTMAPVIRKNAEYDAIRENAAETKALIDSISSGNNLFSPDGFVEGVYPKGFALGQPIDLKPAANSCMYQKALKVVAGKTYCFSYKGESIASTKRYLFVCDDDKVIKQIPCQFTQDAYVKRTFTSEFDGWLYIYLPIDATEIMVTYGEDHGDYVAPDNRIYGITPSHEFVPIGGPSYHNFPDYYVDHLIEKTGQIAELDNSAENRNLSNFVDGQAMDRFIFLTDYHAPTNAKKSPMLVSWLFKRGYGNFVVYAGDILNDPVSAKEADLMFSEFFEAFSDVKDHMYDILGNHEYAATDDDKFTKYQLYNKLCSHKERDYVYVDKATAVYAIENNASKIFYAFVPSESEGTITTDIAYSYAKCLELAKNDYRVVTFAHGSVSRKTNDITGGLSNIINALVAARDGTSITIDSKTVTYTNKNIIPVCIMGGHYHVDYSKIVNGILIISTISDSLLGYVVDPDDSSATPVDKKNNAGTVNEQSFDIVTIEPMLKSTNHGTIHCTRIGAGYDRTFTY